MKYSNNSSANRGLLLENRPTSHKLIQGDARNLSFIADESVHLIVTSPPYWTLKRYNDSEGQLGHVADYENFISQLEKVWREVFRILVPGGRLVCVVGDVCLSRRENAGRHTVVPLHADICVTCRKIGFDNLNPIIWHKISNASYEVSNGSKLRRGWFRCSLSLATPSLTRSAAPPQPWLPPSKRAETALASNSTRNTAAWGHRA